MLGGASAEKVYFANARFVYAKPKFSEVRVYVDDGGSFKHTGMFRLGGLPVKPKQILGTSEAQPNAPRTATKGSHNRQEASQEAL